MNSCQCFDIIRIIKDENVSSNSGIITTSDEIKAFDIIKTILKKSQLNLIIYQRRMKFLQMLIRMKVNMLNKILQPKNHMLAGDKKIAALQ